VVQGKNLADMIEQVIFLIEIVAFLLKYFFSGRSFQ
jgi:hypothetical protein